MSQTPITDRLVAEFDAQLPFPVVGPSLAATGAKGRNRALFAAMLFRDLEQRMFGPDPDRAWQVASADHAAEQWTGAWRELRENRARIEAELRSLGGEIPSPA